MNNTTSSNSTFRNTTLGNKTNIGAASSCVASQPLEKNFRVVLCSLLVIVSIFGNMLIIFVVAKNKRMHTVANYLICNMSVADLLITFLPMIWEIVKLMHYSDGTWPMGSFMCPFMYMCIYLSVSCSILSLTTITFDRFFAIIFPMKLIMTKRLLPFLLVAIWLASVAFASPTIFAQKLSRSDGKLYCMEIWKAPFNAEESPKHYTIILFVGLYVIPLLVMAVLYTAIGTKLWRRHNPGNRTTESDRHSLKQKKKVIKMLITVVLIFAICWFPVFLAQFLYFFNSYFYNCPAAFPHWLQFTSFFLQYLSSAINPYVYLTFSQSFRRGTAHAARGILPNVILSRLDGHVMNSTVVMSVGGSDAFTVNRRNTKVLPAAANIALTERAEIKEELSNVEI